jgi:uncharacterized membrane protein
MPETHLTRRVYYPARGAHTGVRKVVETHELQPTMGDIAAGLALGFAAQVVAVAIPLLLIGGILAAFVPDDTKKS